MKINLRHTASANSCGVHIHIGSSCGLEDAIGGHKHGLTEDPWGSIVYTDASTELVVLDWGYDVSEAYNALLVIHNQAGNRVACSVIGASGSYTIDPVSTYPAYDDRLTPQGSVLVEFIGNVAQITWTGM